MYKSMLKIGLLMLAILGINTQLNIVKAGEEICSINTVHVATWWWVKPYAGLDVETKDGKKTGAELTKDYDVYQNILVCHTVLYQNPDGSRGGGGSRGKSTGKAANKKATPKTSRVKAAVLSKKDVEFGSIKDADAQIGGSCEARLIFRYLKNVTDPDSTEGFVVILGTFELANGGDKTTGTVLSPLKFKWAFDDEKAGDSDEFIAFAKQEKGEWKIKSSVTTLNLANVQGIAAKMQQTCDQKLKGK